MINQPKCFSKDWFKQNQEKLLWLANNPIGRYILRINGNRSSVGKNKIVQIDPNGIFWETGERKNGKKVHGFEIRTHDKFTKRLYYAGYPIWAAMHQMDEWALDKIACGKYSFGFSSWGPFYPDAGSGGTTVDGQVARTNGTQSWASLRDGAGSASSAVLATMLCEIVSKAAANEWDNLYRMITLFDTSTIGGVVDSGIYSLYGDAAGSTYAVPPAFVPTGCSPALDNAISNSDYDIAKWSNIDFAPAIAYASWTNGAYNDFILNGAGIAAINPAGITKLGVRTDWDVDNDNAHYEASKYTYIRAFSADTAGVANDPKLSGTTVDFTPKYTITT